MKIHVLLWGYGIALTCAAAVATVIGLQMLAGFIVGVVVTLGAAAIAGADFD
jgi:hypothetical protein